MPAFHLILTRDEDCADGEDGKGVDDIQHGSIEYGFVPEDGGYHGIAHETDVAEHQCKADNPFVGLFVREQSRQPDGDCRQDGVSNDAYQQQW